MALNHSTRTDTLLYVHAGVLVETFETAVSWARFATFVPSVIEAVNKALEEQGCQGAVTVRLTHAYTGVRTCVLRPCGVRSHCRLVLYPSRWLRSLLYCRGLQP